MESMAMRNPPNIAERRSENVATRFATAGDPTYARLTNALRPAAHATKSSRIPRNTKNAPASRLRPIMWYRIAAYAAAAGARRTTKSAKRFASTYAKHPWYPERISRRRAAVSAASRSEALTDASPKNTSVKNIAPARFWKPARFMGESRYRHPSRAAVPTPTARCATANDGSRASVRNARRVNTRNSVANERHLRGLSSVSSVCLLRSLRELDAFRPSPSPAADPATHKKAASSAGDVAAGEAFFFPRPSSAEKKEASEDEHPKSTSAAPGGPPEPEPLLRRSFARSAFELATSSIHSDMSTRYQSGSSGDVLRGSGQPTPAARNADAQSRGAPLHSAFPPGAKRSTLSAARNARGEG